MNCGTSCIQDNTIPIMYHIPKHKNQKINYLPNVNNRNRDIYLKYSLDLFDRDINDNYKEIRNDKNTDSDQTAQ